MKIAAKQKAVYWANPVSDGMGGSTYDTPIEIDVRWEDKQENFVDASGEMKVSRAVVYVKQDMKVGERLFLGLLTDLDSSQDPQTQDDAFRIAAFAKIPSVRATEFLRKVWL